MNEAGELVLSVDDEQSFHEIVRTVIEAGGFRVEEACDGEEAIKKAMELRPQIILLDMKMPGMSGAEVLTKLKEHDETKDIPVIFLTNFGDPRVEFESDKHFADQVGAQAFVSKSKLAEELLPKVRSILNK
jgi:two-component system phosphate regulon response regulator PhoB